MLATHPDIAGVFNEDKNKGIKESRYFSDLYGRYGDLRNPTNLVEFIEVLAVTDYFKLMGITGEFLYLSSQNTYEGLFRTAMDEYAVNNGAQNWVEKTPGHTRMLPQLADYYPDAKFIAVTRKVEPVVASTLEFHKRTMYSVFWPKQRILAILFSVLERAYYNKIIIAFARKSDRILIVNYEELIVDLPGTLRKVSDFVGVEYAPDMASKSYRQNTSFRNEKQRSSSLTWMDRRIIKAAELFMKPIPTSAISWAERNWFKIKGRREISPSHFRLLMKDIRKLKEESATPEPNSQKPGSLVTSNMRG